MHVPEVVPAAPRLEALHLSWAVGERFVLLDLHWSLPRGCLALLTGANGAGKSTLLDLLAGLRQPLRGQVALDGVPLPEVDPGHLAGRVARLGHKPGLYLDLTAHENIELFSRLAGQPASADLLTAQLADLGIAPQDQHRPLRGLSRGMVQRIALARIRSSGADIWLLDEPSTGLDADGGAVLASTLAAARARGVTIVVATHDPQLMHQADQRMELRHGLLHPCEVSSC